MITLCIDYGYDVHSIKLTEKTHAAVKAGNKVKIDGQGFWHEEDGEVEDHWVFNAKPGEIYFWLDNGAEFFAQDFWVDDTDTG